MENIGDKHNEDVNSAEEADIQELITSVIPSADAPHSPLWTYIPDHQFCFSNNTARPEPI